MPRILETKARYADLGRARRLLAEAGGDHRGAVQQQDTYFHVPQGWLKLRTHHETAELVAYGRTPASATHTCTFAVTPVGDADACREGLTAVLGVRAVVRKRREVWTFGATTVHLDDVEGLGQFIELETPAAEPDASAPDIVAGSAREAHRTCAAVLQIPPRTHITGSYCDLLVASIH